MLNENTIVICAINSLALVLSLLVFTLILKTEYKDFSNYAILLLILSDIFMACFGILGAFETSMLSCKIILCFRAYFRQCHVFLIFLIGFTLFSVIVKDKKLNVTLTLLIFVLGNICCIIVAIISISFDKTNINSSYCIFDDELTDENLEIFGFGMVIPSVFVQLLIIYYYYKIRLKLKEEAGIYNLKCTRNRIFAKRVLGYCMVFGFFFIPFFIMIYERKISHKNSSERYLTEMVCICIYQILNLLIYGSVKSSTRHIAKIFMTNYDFDELEAIVNEMRQENILHPRFYLDLLE